MLNSVILILNLKTLNLDVFPLDGIPGTLFRRLSFRRYSHLFLDIIPARRMLRS